MLFFYYFIEICVRTLRIENFIAVHDGNEIFGVAQVDDVVGVAGEHDDGLNLIATHLIFDDF